MGKPDDIPQDVWDTGHSVINAGRALGTTDRNKWAALVGRSIMAEADRIAAMAEEFGMVAGEPALVTFAEIIRNRGEG